MSETPEEIQAKIAELQSELDAANLTQASAPTEIATLEAEKSQEIAAEEVQAEAPAQIAEEQAAEEVAPAPVMAPQPSIVKRILPTGQFQTPQEGTDKQ